MRSVASVLACVGVALALAGCDPVTNRHYFREGIGTGLYSEAVKAYPLDTAEQTRLQDEYVQQICHQAGLAEGSCDIDTFSPTTWSLFVQAGMNDIDQRCDAYLSWLDYVRRSRDPTVKQLADMQTASTVVLQQTGVGAVPIAIAAAAFGLATNTFNNVTSRLILEVDHSTVQAVVLGNQKKFREDLLGTGENKTKIVIASKPAAIYALRSYLRMCMPMTIETQINNTIATFERGGADALKKNPSIISAKSVGIIRDVNAPLRPFTPPPSPPGRTWVGPYEKTMSQKDMDRALAILGCPGKDLGPEGSDTRKALTKFLTDNGKPAADRLTVQSFIDLREIGKKGTCSK